MIKQRNTKMYIASQRGAMEDDDCEMFCTLNYAQYWNEVKQPINSLSHICEIFLKKGKRYTFAFKEKLSVVLIPLYNQSTVHFGKDCFDIFPGKVAVIPSSMTLSVENINQEDCCFLLLALNEKKSKILEPVVEDLDINLVKNQFQCLKKFPNIKIASMDARSEIQYSCASDFKSAFLYNLNGSMEASGCLIGPCDGLLIHGNEPFEIEAFEPNTIVLLIDL